MSYIAGKASETDLELREDFELYIPLAYAVHFVRTKAVQPTKHHHI